jgi:hypothetical protein
MGLSFQEKSLWLTFVGLVVVFGFYFWIALAALPMHGPDVMPPHVALVGVAVAVLVITQIAGHVVVAVLDRRTETDERDRLIALVGTRNGAYVLATGVFLALYTAILTEGNFACAHVLLASWVLAQLVEIGSQLFLYRRGV